MATCFVFWADLNRVTAQTPSHHNYYLKQPKSILKTPRVAQRPIHKSSKTVSTTVKSTLRPPKKRYQPKDFGIQPIQQVKVDIRSDLQDSIPENHAERLLAKETKIQYLSEPFNYRITQSDIPASEIQHRPLYFEEMNLERHGTGFRFMQPFVSGTRFVAAVPLLPYKMTLNPPRRTMRSHDLYPSGLPAPWVRERGRFSPLATSSEVLAIATAILIIP